MAEERTSITYDFNWEIEDLTQHGSQHSCEYFYPLKTKCFIYDDYVKKPRYYNPQFRIFFKHVVSYNGKGFHKHVFQYFLDVSDRQGKELGIQYRIRIQSTSNEWAETSNKEERFFKSPTEPMALFVAVVQNATLRVAEKVMPFNQDHNFLGLKCHFKICYKEHVIPKPIIKPKLAVPPERLCNLCFDFKKLYDSKEMADVTITVGDDSLLAHKLVLATRSPVFKAMLDNDCLESNTNTIQITDIDASVFDHFLKYLYCSEIADKSYDVVRNLYVLADKYAVDGLKVDCRDILEVELKVGTVCQLLELSQLFTDAKLKEKALEFMKQHFSVVSKKPEWKNMCKDYTELASDVLERVTLFLDQSKSN